MSSIRSTLFVGSSHMSVMRLASSSLLSGAYSYYQVTRIQTHQGETRLTL